MRKFSIIVVLAGPILALGISGIASAQVVENQVSFNSVVEAAEAPDGVLIGGKTVDPRLFRAVLVSTHPSPTGEGRCTSTIVGFDTVLTAAHCVDAKNPADRSQTRPMTVQLDGASHSYICEMHPEYARARVPVGNAPRNSRDVALCKRSQSGSLDIRREYFENVSLSPRVRVEEEILVGGYGCQIRKRPDGQWVTYQDQGKKYYRMADNAVSAHMKDQQERPTTTTPIDGRMVTFEAMNFSWFQSRSTFTDEKGDLCSGDSGGPTFFGTSFKAAQTYGAPRTISGVNSANNLNPGTQIAVSFYTDLTDPDVSDWVKTWSQVNGAQICGVTVGAVGCRTNVANGRELEPISELVQPRTQTPSPSTRSITACPRGTEIQTNGTCLITNEAEYFSN